MRKVQVVDSHTEGEPTRVIIEGGPKLRSDTLAGCVRELREEHDQFRKGVVLEPRGYSAVVGALLMPPMSTDAEVGVIYFNNAGYLGMCGHGTIGLIETLRHLGRLLPGKLRINTPVGVVKAELLDDGRVTVFNVPSYRYRAGVSVAVDGYGNVIGDIAYGGNWFFLTETTPCPVIEQNIRPLTEYTIAVLSSLCEQGITGDNGEIDHVEVFGPPERSDAQSKNYVLCPGLEYDRSPCGTGTSAKVACLAADAKLKPGELYRQESIIGTLFEAGFDWSGDKVLPHITGRAWITAEASLIFKRDDPLI